MSKFYQSFIDIVSTNTQEKKFSKEKTMHLIEEKGKETESVSLVSSTLVQALRKPQQLLHDDDDYYIAIDMMTSTYYICYRDLMMIDIDFYKDREWSTEEQNSKWYEQTQDVLDKLAYYSFRDGHSFKVYRSRGGLHIFVTSSPKNYKNLEDMQIMLDLQSDFFYTVYSHLRGWSVRLNRKEREKEMSYTFLMEIGHEHDERLCKLVDLHINLIEVYKNVKPSSMYGV